jgi:hypothetical protein
MQWFEGNVVVFVKAALVSDRQQSALDTCRGRSAAFKGDPPTVIWREGRGLSLSFAPERASWYSRIRLTWNELWTKSQSQ